ncbi:hypothetical protein V1477_000769 [Vespula maculifrons]|uniref:Uncharacterized protein n=1 Tax=Vespula maculifrons TaxID=7453 RepID=A0ABD2CZZ2_VESMC
MRRFSIFHWEGPYFSSQAAAADIGFESKATSSGRRFEVSQTSRTIYELPRERAIFPESNTFFSARIPDTFDVLVRGDTVRKAPSRVSPFLYRLTARPCRAAFYVPKASNSRSSARNKGDVNVLFASSCANTIEQVHPTLSSFGLTRTLTVHSCGTLEPRWFDFEIRH